MRNPKYILINWFYYLNRGIRWSQAVLSDLAIFTTPVFILSDLEALLYALNSSFWDNMKNDRVRRLNAELFNKSQKYLDNEITYNSKIINSIQKLRYEYFSRLMVFLKEKNNTTIKHQLNNNYSKQSKNFNKYFRTSLNNILNDNSYSYNAQRTAITINDVLLFLEGK